MARKNRNSVSKGNSNSKVDAIARRKKLQSNQFFQMLQQKDNFKEKVLETIESRNGMLKTLRVTEEQLAKNVKEFKAEEHRM